MRSNCYLRGRGLHGAALRDVFCVTLSARALSDPVIMDNLKLSRRAAECFPHTAFQRPPRPSSPSPLTASSVNCTPVKLLTLFCFPDISRARLLVLHFHKKKKKEMILKPLNRTSPLHRFLRRNVLRSYLTAAPYRLSLVTPLTDFVSSPSLRGTPLIVPIDWRSDCIGNSSSSWDPSSGLSLPCALQEQANPFELASFQLTC